MQLGMADAIFVLTFAASVMPVAAHHSVPGTFDISTEVTIRGEVTRIEWTNPHVGFGWMQGTTTAPSRTGSLNYRLRTP